MKVLSVATFAHPDHFGGGERVIAAVARGLARRGHEVTLLTSRLDGTLAEEQLEGVRIIRYAVELGRPVRFYRSVWRGVRSALAAGVGRTADVLHVHQTLSAVAAIAPGGSPVRARMASFYAPYHLEYLARFRAGHDVGRVPPMARVVSAGLARADRFVLARCSRILVLSEFSRAQLTALLPGATDRATIAPAGIDLERFSPARDEHHRVACRQRLGLPTDPDPLIVSVRRLVPRMGLPDLLDATAHLVAGGHPVRVAVAGQGPEREALQAQTERLGLADRVTFLGRVDEDALPDLYRAASIFVLPTRSLEGFGMATAEALAAGLPVVATDAGATSEVLGPIAGARLVAPGRPDALAEALAPLVDDPELRATVGLAARQHAERHLGWEHHLDAWELAARQAVEDARR